MTHNSTVDFKLIPFLLWIKGSHHYPNFETSNCSGENLLYSSCHFPNQKSVFLQILHHRSVSWKITPLYFCSSNNIYVARKEPIKVKVKIFETFECSVQFKICQISYVSIETASRFLSKFSIPLHFLERKLLCTFLAQRIYFLLKRTPLKWKLLRLLRAQVKICQIPDVKFETTSWFLSKFCIPLQFRER